MLTYKIYDTQEETYLKGSFTSRKLAKLKADRLDNEHGSYRYVVFSEVSEVLELEQDEKLTHTVK